MPKKVTEDPAIFIPAGPVGVLTAAFAKAAGAVAATETLNGVRERSAADYIGWPPPGWRRACAARRQAQARGQRPRARRAGAAVRHRQRDQRLRQRGGRAARALVADGAGGGALRADEAQAALGTAVARGLPPRDKVTSWWRLIALAQWLLVALTLVGLIWIVLILAIGGGSSGPHKSSLISDVSLTPWLGVMVVALLLLGWLISSWCQNMVVLAADREREQAVRDILARIAAVTNDSSWYRSAASSATTSTTAPNSPPPATAPPPRTGGHDYPPAPGVAPGGSCPPDRF